MTTGQRVPAALIGPLGLSPQFASPRLAQCLRVASIVPRELPLPAVPVRLTSHRPDGAIGG